MAKRDVNAISKGRAAKGKRETAGDPITAYPRALRRGETDEKYLGVLNRINRAAAGMPQEEDAQMFAMGGEVGGCRGGGAALRGTKFRGVL